MTESDLPMDKELLRNLLSRFNKYAFSSFVLEYLRSNNSSPIEPVIEAGEGVFDQWEWTAWEASRPSILIVHYLPLELFSMSEKVNIGDPDFVEKLRNVQRIYESEKIHTLLIFSNIAGFTRRQYDDTLAPSYLELVKDVGIKKLTTFKLGSYDSLVDGSLVDSSENTARFFRNFVETKRDGLSITLDADVRSVEKFSFETNLSAGVLKPTDSPCEPVFISSSDKEDVIREFESLIHPDAKEAQLERFLVAHYQEIFGFHYDRIEPQLWLNFPELDITKKNRRLDIFLRNSIERDWELIEIKRVIKLTGSYRDAPVLAHEIHAAIQQVKIYARTLSQDSVKRELAQRGIEYYYPSLRLVVGKRPQISREQWRWLKSTNERDVRITTFDELLDEMRVRLTQRFQLEGDRS
jgi:hypothetical protein